MDNNNATAFGLLSIVAKCSAVFCNTAIFFLFQELNVYVVHITHIKIYYLCNEYLNFCTDVSRAVTLQQL